MLKEHKVTGLKYLCQHFGTKDSCFKYTGSGTYWKSHLRTHGCKINTTILFETYTKESLAIKGLEYSTLYDVVNSNEFANLIPETGSGSYEPMRPPHIREKARQTLLNRHKIFGPTEKELNRSLKLKQRIQEQGFTPAELNRHKLTQIRQQGKTMQERLNRPGYIDPRKGKTAKEICGGDYNGPWNKGYKMTDLRGSNYIDPKSKPFKIISHLGVFKYKSESDFINQTKFSNSKFIALKRDKCYTVKRQKNSKHPYKHGETIYFEYISTNELLQT